MDALNNAVSKLLEIEKLQYPLLLEQLTLYFYYKESPNTDLYLLSKTLSEESVVKIIEYFGGETFILQDVNLPLLLKILDHEEYLKLSSFFNDDVIRIPTKDEHKRIKLLAIYYFLREINNTSWEDIRMIIPITEEINVYSVGKKIQQMKLALYDDVAKFFKKYSTMVLI